MRTFIIGEAGVNHNGKIDLALKLVDAACEAGCDAVKFQTFKADKLVTGSARKAEYQIRNTGSNETQYEMLKRLELGYKEHEELFAYCEKKKIIFMSTPFDEESADMLENLGMQIFKIPSGEITNKPLLQHIAKKQKPLILSTGMSTLGEVEEALSWIYGMGNTEVSLLHCTSNYPTAMKDVNLKTMVTLKNSFGLKAGYSDHTQGIEIPVAAVAMGAEIIEKHFTLSKNMEGPDHKASLEPDELKEMVKAIRNIEDALGDGIKKPSINEMDNREISRKSIVLSKAITEGQTITPEMISLKRPGTGLEPKYWDVIINKKAVCNFQEGHIFQLGDFY